MAATFIQAMISAYGGISNTLPAIWSEQISDTVESYPRTEFNHLGEVPVYSQDGTVETTNARAQICYYSTSLVDVDNVCKTIRDALTPTSLTIDGFRNRLWRQNYIAAIDMERT